MFSDGHAGGDREKATHLTAGVAKLPAAVEVRGGRHGVADAGHADVGEGQVDDDVVGGRAQLLELDKHHEDHDVAREADHA